MRTTGIGITRQQPPRQYDRNVQQAAGNTAPRFSGGTVTTARAAAGCVARKENRDALNAFMYMLAIPSALSVGWLVPGPGWLIAAAGLPVSLLSYRHGKKYLEKATQGEKLSKNAGPIAHSVKTQDLWFQAEPGKGKKFVDSVNGLINQTFKDDGPVKHSKKLRRTFRLTEGSQPEYLTRLAYETNAHYSSKKLQGKMLSFMRKGFGLPPPFKWIAAGIYGTAIATGMLAARRTVARQTAKAATQAVR